MKIKYVKVRLIDMAHMMSSELKVKLRSADAQTSQYVVLRLYFAHRASSV